MPDTSATVEVSRLTGFNEPDRAAAISFEQRAGRRFVTIITIQTSETSVSFCANTADLKEAIFLAIGPVKE